MEMKRRIFKKKVAQHIGEVKSSVNYWYWMKGKGLFVVYNDGLDVRSCYTLRELLGKGKPEGDIVEY
jgi:hypothetical protein